MGWNLSYTWEVPDIGCLNCIAALRISISLSKDIQPGFRLIRWHPITRKFLAKVQISRPCLCIIYCVQVRTNLSHMRSTLQGKAPCLQHMVKSIAVYEMRVLPLQEWRFFAWQINELSCFSIALVFLVIYAKPKTMITLSLHR